MRLYIRHESTRIFLQGAVKQAPLFKPKTATVWYDGIEKVEKYNTEGVRFWFKSGVYR